MRLWCERWFNKRKKFWRVIELYAVKKILIKSRLQFHDFLKQSLSMMNSFGKRMWNWLFLVIFHSPLSVWVYLFTTSMDATINQFWLTIYLFKDLILFFFTAYWVGGTRHHPGFGFLFYSVCIEIFTDISSKFLRWIKDLTPWTQIWSIFFLFAVSLQQVFWHHRH